MIVDMTSLARATRFVRTHEETWRLKAYGIKFLVGDCLGKETR